MNIKEAKQEIKNTVKAYLLKKEDGSYQIPTIRQRPILLMGAPGIGKTQIMEQIANEMEIGLVAYTITHHTRQSAVGLPRINEQEYEGRIFSVTDYTMSEIIASIYRYMKMTGKKEGILFIDEINCVSETLAPTILQFLQNKTFGNEAVPQGWIICCAGNPPEYNRSVRNFDMVTLDRLRYINVEADYEVWKAYAYQQKVSGVILSYLELRQKYFYRIQMDVDGLRFVTPRGWEDFSNLLMTYRELDIPVTVDVAKEFLHDEEVAEDFAVYYGLYNKYKSDYRISEILVGQAKPDLYERLLHAEFDERFSVVHLILDALFLHFSKQDEAVSVMLENAFAFIKDAFGEGQEMVVFVTELSIQPDAVSYIAKHPSPYYKEYSRLLMMSREKRNLLRELS
ncbi:MAG: AAA family ATPase [Lachnospiraceae bacterium]|nr:AAA family ATPase [Lachnospiraceae bacterium]